MALVTTADRHQQQGNAAAAPCETYYRLAQADRRRRVRARQGAYRRLFHHRSCASEAPVNKEKIAQEADKVLSKRDKNVADRDKAMSDTVRAQQLFSEAYPDVRYPSVKDLYRDAFRFLSKHMTKDLTYRRVRAIREGKARRIDGEELDALRLAVIEEGRNEAANLRARLASLDEKIAAFEAFAHRETLARSVPEVGRPGGMDH